MLSRLPIEESNFLNNTFLRPLYDAVRTALNEDQLLPTSNGKHVPATRGKLARGQKLTELINAKQLSSLFGQQDLEWLDPSITSDQYPTLHRYLVGAKKYALDSDWIVKPLVKAMEVRVEDFAEKLSANFMVEQTDTWVVNFYKFLQEGRGQICSHFRTKPMIRLECGKHVPPFSDDRGTPNSYLPTEVESDLPTVKRALVKDKKVLEFLQELKLQVPDTTDEVMEMVLPRYDDGKSVEVADWERDFKKILAALQCQDEAKLCRLKEKLKVSKWVLVQARSGEALYRVPPSKAYVLTDELGMYFKRGDEARFLADGYFTEDEVEILLSLGVARSPRVTPEASRSDCHVTLANSHSRHKRGLDGFDPGWEVDGLEKALVEPSLDVSAYVWNQIAIRCTHLIRGITESSSQKTFEKARRKEEWSGTGKLLRDTAWLPDGGGRFKKPGHLMLRDLPDQFDQESQQAKRLAEALNMKQPETVKAIDALSGGNDRLKAIFERLSQGDVDDELLDKLDKLLPRPEPVKPPPTFKDAVQSIHRKVRSKGGEEDPPPGGDVQNPDRYVEKLKEDIAQKRREQLVLNCIN